MCVRALIAYAAGLAGTRKEPGNEKEMVADSIIGRIAVVVVLFIAVVVVLFFIAYLALFLLDLIF
jgi:hypothetical protein